MPAFNTGQFISLKSYYDNFHLCKYIWNTNSLTFLHFIRWYCILLAVIICVLSYGHWLRASGSGTLYCAIMMSEMSYSLYL